MLVSNESHRRSDEGRTEVNVGNRGNSGNDVAGDIAVETSQQQRSGLQDEYGCRIGSLTWAQRSSSTTTVGRQIRPRHGTSG